jgi:hypothetical protein
MKNPLILLILVQTMLQIGCEKKAAPAKIEQPKEEPAKEEPAVQEVWNGTADIDWYKYTSGEYTITTAEQLAGLAELVNNGNKFKGKTVKLGANIMLNDTANWKNWANDPPANKWVPIGTERDKFNHDFDGNGYVVSGVYVISSDDYQGLFGSIDDIGTVKNLGVIASYIKGGNYVGGLAGRNCMIADEGDYRAGKIGNSYFIGTVTGTGWFVGGLVGNNYGEINGSYFVGSVFGETIVGGLVGNNGEGSINNSYSISTVTGTDKVGGFAGNNVGTINNSYSAGKVTGDTDVGGFAGAYEVEIDNSYYDKEISTQSDEGKGIGKTTAEMKQKSTYEGWDFDNVWGISGEVNGGYPYLLTSP